tara:strand:- start:1438 stop:2256 length:819 start_codon:yes stop_codon:yes gene_type:complete
MTDFFEQIGYLETFISLAVFGWAIISPILLWRSKRRQHKFTQVKFPTDKRDFYAYFRKCIDKAKSEIVITGDGFNLRNAESLKNAAPIESAIERALGRGITVHRYQIVSTMTVNYLMRLERLKRAYPDQFFVYVNSSFENIGMFCVIDAGTRKTVFEQQMVSGPMLARGTEPHDFAFVLGHQAKSNRGRRLIESIRNDDLTTCLGADDFEALRQKLWNERKSLALGPTHYAPIDPELVTCLSSSDKNCDYRPELFSSLANLEIVDAEHDGGA